MKTFIKRVIFFALGFMTLLLLVFMGSNMIIAKGDYFKIPESKHTVILGHSHSACAFDDSLIPGFYNISQNTEGYPYSYFKARTVLEHNTHIKRIFVEVTNNQIDPWAENRISGLYLDVNAPRSFPILDFDFTRKTLVRSKRPKRIISAVLKGIRSNMNFLMGDEKNYINTAWKTHKTPSREFVPLEKDVQIKPEKNKVESGEPQEELISEKNIRYLKKVVELCDNEGVQLYFVRSPFPASVRHDNEKQFQDLLNSELKNISFLDFKDFPLPNNMFADKQHLNVKGQLLFSKFFNELMNAKILEREDIQIEINKRMDKFKIDYHNLNQLN